MLKKGIFPIGQSGEASRLRVCYQWGLPRLVYSVNPEHSYVPFYSQKTSWGSMMNKSVNKVRVPRTESNKSIGIQSTLFQILRETSTTSGVCFENTSTTNSGSSYSSLSSSSTSAYSPSVGAFSSSKSNPTQKYSHGY